MSKAATLPFDRIIAEIKAQGFSERGTCAGAGLDASTLSKARANGKKLALDTIEKLCAWLEKPVSWALGEEPATVAAPMAAPDGFLSYNQLVRSDLNPRKDFGDLADEEMQALAESIAENGVLQNLLVRPLDHRFTIVFGERRWRAVGMLVTAGRWDPERPNIPVRIRQLTDAEHLALALLENLQRRAMEPLEEAEAFVQLQKLDPKLWTPAAIAKKIGFTVRYVQYRMKLATSLAPDAQQALRDHKINIKQARVIAIADKATQAEMLEDLALRPSMSAEDLREYTTSAWAPAANAIFPLEGPQAPDCGEIFIDDETGERWFTDIKKFTKAQEAAAQHQAEQLRQQNGLGFAKMVSHFTAWEWKSDKKNPKAGVVWEIDYEGKVKFHVGYRKKTAGEQQQSMAPRGETPERKAERARHEKQREACSKLDKEVAAALASNSGLALRLAALDAITGFDQGMPFGWDGLLGGASPSYELPSRFAPFFTKSGAVKENVNRADLWKAMKLLTDTQVNALLAAAVAGRVDMPVDEKHYAPGGMMALMLKDLDIAVPEILLPQQVDLEETAPKAKKKAAE